MTRKWFASTALLLTLAAPMIMAQGRGSGGGMQARGPQGSPGMQGGQRGQSGMGSQMGQQDRQRIRIHATEEQRRQFGTYTESMERVRSRIREMSRGTRGQSINAQQARQLHQQIRNELQTMQQEREQVTSGLDEEQRAAVQNRLQQMTRNQEQLEGFSEALGFELDQASLDGDKVREQARNMDRTSKDLQKEQRDLGAVLGIDQ